MSDQAQPILIYTTLPSVEEARRVGAELVRRRLAACVNILPGMTALFAWEGRLDEAQEAAMLIKTRRGLRDAAIDALVDLHPYDTPAALAIPVDGGSADFCAWIAEQTQGGA